MAFFGYLYLDKEKDIILDLDMEKEKLSYTLRTPNHGTGNLITNFAKLCGLPMTRDEEGLLIIQGEIPCYVDGENRMVYVLRLADTKVANIYPDGTIERKAYIPAIAKTLMSQTKDYTLNAHKTLVKTYIRKEVKFHSDLHTHRSANLSPDLLIALGIHHQLRYPYYYVKKLGLRLTAQQRAHVEELRAITARDYLDSGLQGKYLDRKIDDHTEVNFADLILGNLKDSAYNIPKIRASLAVMKDGQAVFTNLEKVYLYRYVFTKGTSAKERLQLEKYSEQINQIPDQDIVNALHQMDADRRNPVYENNTLYQDKLLWIARSYQKQGIVYAEISDTALVKASEAAQTLQEIHDVMPEITKETGVTLRFLAALRRIPLTIVKDKVATGDYFRENLQVLSAIAEDPYVAGSDFVGEEINDIRELKSVIAAVVKIAKKIPSFVVRIHAGENDSLPDNVLNSILCVEDGLEAGQQFPQMRVGHGLYTEKLNSAKGKLLLEKLNQYGIVLEFQISSNVRLNNLSQMSGHPLKQYLNHGVLCVQGTDGGALYGSDSIDEQLSLERMLELSFEDMYKMRQAEERVLKVSMEGFEEKKILLQIKTEEFQRTFDAETNTDIDLDRDKERDVESKIEKGQFSKCIIAEYMSAKIQEAMSHPMDVAAGPRRHNSEIEFEDQIQPLPNNKIPIVIAGGSFNHSGRITRVRAAEKAFLDDFLKRADPQKYFLVIGPSISGYEKYVLEKASAQFEIFAFVPKVMTETECRKVRRSGAKIRVSIESTPLGVYKSFAFEIFKRRQSIILALDGNSAAANLIQDAKNSKYKSRTFINARSQALRQKAESLQGYITMLREGDCADEILQYGEKYYEALSDPEIQIIKNRASK